MEDSPADDHLPTCGSMGNQPTRRGKFTSPDIPGPEESQNRPPDCTGEANLSLVNANGLEPKIVVAQGCGSTLIFKSCFAFYIFWSMVSKGKGC